MIVPTCRQIRTVRSLDGLCLGNYYSKTTVMHVGNCNPHFSYNIDGQLLEKVTKHKDLGVVFDKMMKFHSHVYNSLEGKKNFGYGY